MKFTSFIGGAAATATLVAAGVASATTYDITWSGAPFGNSASATGYITVDSAYPAVGGFAIANLPSPDVTALSITVTGSGSGDGTFGYSDFGFVYFWTPTALDLTTELIGQPVSGGTDFYGDSDGGGGGDFNIFGTTPGFGPAPYGTFYFELTTDGGNGDTMLVTSIIATGTPEPATWAMMLVGFGLAGAALRRRTAATLKA